MSEIEDDTLFVFELAMVSDFVALTTYDGDSLGEGVGGGVIVFVTVSDVVAVSEGDSDAV